MEKSINAGGKVLLAGSLLALITACGGGGSDNIIDLPGLVVTGAGGEPAESIFNPWLVSVRTFRQESDTPSIGDARVATLQYDDSQTLQQHIDFYGDRELESCEITPVDDGGGGTSDSSNIPYIDGGNAVVINAPNGTWYTINQVSTGIYEVDNELPDSIPAGATISIPGGGVFPSVSAIPLSEPSAPIRILPAPGPVSIDSVYRWQAAAGAGESIRLSFLEYDSAGNFIDFRIGCNAIDDGEFELPADVINAIATNTNTLVARYTRVKRSLDLVAGVVVFSRISVAE